MKLRNKLAAVMAASMVVTAVPVVTMADSTNALSIYNYTIKDGTVGFKTTDRTLHVEVKDGDRTTKPVLNVKIAYTEGDPAVADNAAFRWNDSSVKNLEITPENRYDVNAQSAFLYLTEDSEYIKEAYVAYVDAVNNGGTSQAYVDANGKVQNAATTAWNDKKVDDLIVNGELKVGFQVDPSDRYATVVKAGTGDATVTLKPTEEAGAKFNDKKFKHVLRMDFEGTFEKGVTYPVAFLAKVGGDNEVQAYLDGRDSFVTSKSFVVTGKLSDKKVTATADDKTITTDNIEEIGEIRLDENQIGALAQVKEDDRWIKIVLPSSSDLEFNIGKTQSEAKAVIQRGIDRELKDGQENFTVRLGNETRHRYSTTEEDAQTLLIRLPKVTKKDGSPDTAKGRVVLKGIYVQPKDKTAAVGDLNVTLSEDLSRGGKETSTPSKDIVASTTLKVAKVADYGVVIESTPIDVKAGRSGIVADKRATFTLKEAVKDSLVDSRKIEFNLENGYIFGPADVEYSTQKDKKDLTYNYNTDSYKNLAKKTFLKLVDDEKIKFEEKGEIKLKDGKLDQGFDKSSLNLTIDANGYVTGFSARYAGLKSTDDDKIKVTLPVAAPVQAKGEIKVKAGNLFTRSYEKDVEAVIANIKEPVSVEVENAKLKVGKQDQQAGKITIKETDKGMLEKGFIYLSAENYDNLGITYDAAPTVKVTSGNMEVKNVQIDRTNKVIAIEVTKTSTEASTLEISDIKFTADRTVPEANYNLQMWGDALTDENVLDVVNSSTNVLTFSSARSQYSDRYIVKDFITMTTKNTQDLNAAGLKAATAKFVIGENKFTVNGETVSMDAASYVNSENFTMVPVRYVAQAFGIEGNAIQYDKKTSTATIVAGTKVISVTANKPVIVVNGTAMPMATKAVVKDNRMFVPLAYIASALDIQKSWDASTKTATFTNQTEEAK